MERLLCRIAIAVFGAVLITTVLPVAHAAEPEPTIVNVGAYVVNVGKFDVESGSFSADFYLWLSWHGNWSGSLDANAALPEKFELMNGRVDRITLIESDTNVGGGYNYLIYRIQASLVDPVNLQAFPFDKHELTIEIEDQVYTTNQIVYHADPESRLDGLVVLQGWDVQRSLAGGGVVTHHYDTTFGYPGQNSTESYSRFVYTIQIERPFISSVVKTFIPMAVILMIAFVSFLVKPEDFGPRLSLNVTTILTAVAFHLTLTSSIPPVGFLTLADRLMVSVYIVLVFALVVTVVLADLRNNEKLGLVKRLNTVGAIAAPVAAVVLIGMQFFI